MEQGAIKNPVIEIWLKIYAAISILYVIYLWGNFLFVELQSTFQLWEISLCTIVGIINIVGIVYILRNLQFGVFLLLFSNLIIFLLQLFLTENVPIFIWISLFFVIIIFLLLFLKSNGRTIWAQMNKGIDISHFKHIYQLSTLLILMTLCYGGYNYLALRNGKESKNVSEEDVSNKIDKEELLKKLDNVDITLEEISRIENVIKDLPLEYEARIMALKHILAGHIVPDTHDIEAFRMAYFLRKDAMAKEQQEVLDWFFRQHSDVMRVWENSNGCNSIALFQEYIRDIIRTRKITEF